MKRILCLVALVFALSAPAWAQTMPDHFQIILSADGVEMWRADYDRTLDVRTGWTDGDRQGYRCAYMFLLHRGRVAGRVTFTQVRDAAAYSVVNDKFMVEGMRFFDGTVDPTPNQHDDCPAPDQEYESYTGPDQRPVVTYSGPRGVLETRSYPDIVAGAGVIFRQVESTSRRVTVVAYKNGLPVIVVYYDALDPRVSVNSTIGG